MNHVSKDITLNAGCQHNTSTIPTAEAIAKALRGSRTGGQWLARCPAHEDQRPSLSIRDGARGFIFNCLAGCDFKDVRDALRRKGILPAFRPGERTEQAPQPHPAPIALTADELQNREKARRIWCCAYSWLGGTPAEAYLSARGIWAEIDRAEHSLRFARLRHPQTRQESVPCLIVAQSNTLTGTVQAIQHIFLTEDGRKYPRVPFALPDGSSGLADAKISLGIAPDAWAETERRAGKRGVSKPRWTRGRLNQFL